MMRAAIVGVSNTRSELPILVGLFRLPAVYDPVQ